MLKEKILIYSQNVIDLLKFLMRYLGFWYNEIYETFCIFNDNKN